MKRKLVLSAAVVGLLSITAPAFAAGGNGNPGPDGHNNAGLCQAAQSGSPNGQNHKSSAPPFQALASDAAAMNQTVAQYCSQYAHS